MNLIFLIVYHLLEHSTQTSKGPYEEVDRFMLISFELEFRAISGLENVSEQSLFFNKQVVWQKTGSQLKNSSTSVIKTYGIPVLTILNSKSF